jgi:hypothetical protein
VPIDRVVIVLLRRPKPRSVNPSEKRSDPFWEFGSFGVTGCHAKNLMSSRSAERLNGVRLAFAQGGTQGTRLVCLTCLTPPVNFVDQGLRIEARWAP